MFSRAGQAEQGQVLGFGGVCAQSLPGWFGQEGAQSPSGQLPAEQAAPPAQPGVPVQRPALSPALSVRLLLTAPGWGGETAAENWLFLLLCASNPGFITY